MISITKSIHEVFEGLSDGKDFKKLSFLMASLRGGGKAELLILQKRIWNCGEKSIHIKPISKAGRDREVGPAVGRGADHEAERVRHRRCMREKGNEK